MVVSSKIILYIFLFQCIIPKKGSNSKKRPPKKVDQIFFFAAPPKNSQIYFCQKLFFSGIKNRLFWNIRPQQSCFRHGPKRFRRLGVFYRGKTEA